MAICHSVLVSRSPDPPHDLIYKAQSPDEAALVQAAKEAGFAFLSREGPDMVVNVLGEIQRFVLLNVLEFNSDRKRMSVIVRKPEGEIVLYCKGADSVVWERLAEGQEGLKDITEAHLEYFAEEGLRTLCIASTTIPEPTYTAWAKLYTEASLSLTSREAAMDAVAETLERNLNLLGATAIEDKLQEGVPECIATLMDAGMKLWVLTGDKMETAINIGFSCNLLARDMSLILVRGGSAGEVYGEESTARQMREALETFFGKGSSSGGVGGVKRGRGGGKVRKKVSPEMFEEPPSPPPLSYEGENHSQHHHHPNPHTRHALVIDGAALHFALGPTCRSTLLALATRCTAVICCRVSPLQKAQVVELVKHSLGAMCLAIGDGANDVSMIQAAHIGVGIAGEEGLQAVMASDYGIGQFRFLGKLLLVHGRWSYRRTAEMILNFFVKNIIWVLLYNLVFTSLPVGILGVLDQDVSARTSLQVPPIYRIGITHTLFTLPRFLIYILEAIYQSLIVFYIPLLTFSDASAWSNGRPSDVAIMGVTMAMCGVLMSNMFVVVNTQSWTWINTTVVVVSDLAVVLYTVVYSFFPGSTLLGIVAQAYGCALFWAAVVLVAVMCCLPRMAVRYFLRMVRPSDVDIVQEALKVGKIDELIGWGPGVGDGEEGGKGMGGGLKHGGLAGPAISIMEAVPTLEPDTSAHSSIYGTIKGYPTAAPGESSTNVMAIPGQLVPTGTAHPSSRAFSAPPRINTRMSVRSIP
ncbi:hypothetical protein HK104_006184, partial [Borealophlyctis nickersoniae]